MLTTAEREIWKEQYLFQTTRSLATAVAQHRILLPEARCKNKELETLRRINKLVKRTREWFYDHMVQNRDKRAYVVSGLNHKIIETARELYEHHLYEIPNSCNCTDNQYNKLNLWVLHIVLPFMILKDEEEKTSIVLWKKLGYEDTIYGTRLEVVDEQKKALKKYTKAIGPNTQEVEKEIQEIDEEKKKTCYVQKQFFGYNLTEL